MAGQPSYRANGCVINRNDTKRIRWEKILGSIQNRPGSLPANNPAKNDEVRKLKVKILRAIHPPLNGGGGAGNGSVVNPGGGGGPTPIDPVVLQIVTAYYACSAVSDQTQKNAIVKLVSDLITNGLWNSLDAVYPFIGGTSQSNACNLKNPALYKITWHGGVTFDANGITGDGSTGYGDTGFNPASSGGNFSLNSASLGVYYHSASNVSGTVIGSWGNILSNNNTRIVVGISPFSEMIGFSADVSGPIINGPYTGNVIGIRSSATIETFYSGGVSSTLTGGVNASTLSNLNTYILANNLSGSPSEFLPSTLSFAFIGSGFNFGQAATLQTIITTFQTALGRNV